MRETMISERPLDRAKAKAHPCSARSLLASCVVLAFSACSSGSGGAQDGAADVLGACASDAGDAAAEANRDVATFTDTSADALEAPVDVSDARSLDASLDSSDAGE